MIDWPPIHLVRIDEQSHPRRRGMQEIQPWFSRTMPKEWAVLYKYAVQAGETGEWMDAGFVLCAPAEVEDVRTLLRQSIDTANRKYTDYLSQIQLAQPEVADDLLRQDRIVVESQIEGNAYPWRL